MNVPEIYESMEYGPALESADVVRQWLDDHRDGFDHFINGAWCPPNFGSRFATRNPATGEVLGQVAKGDSADVIGAVSAAHKAQPRWAKLGGPGRARYLYAIARLLQKHARHLAVLETMDNGKPIRESRDVDLPLAVRHFYHHAGWAQLMPQELPGYEPLGVAGQIIPWNFPLLMLAWKLAPALAMGNTVVLKPAEYTPLTALRFAGICQEAGLPPGVVNIVTGDGATGAALTRQVAVDKVAFTGSTEVGREIRRETAGSGKKLTLELGGKGPFLVFDDADQDGAVEGLVDAIWFNQGQVCCAGSRLLVQENIHDGFIAKVKARMAGLRVGDPLDKAVDMGAIIDPVQRDRIESLVQAGVAEGATLWRPEGAMSDSLPKDGCFYPPTLLLDVETANVVAREEIFGPVLSVMSFRTPDEAVALANNSRYGLAASVWSENLNLAMDVAPKLRCGVVWINSSNLFDAAAGFGGYRESGFGREGGREGLYEYIKPVHEKSFKPVRTLPMPDTPPEPMGDGEGVDRTAKLYIGGKQTRPDSGYSQPIFSVKGKLVAHVGVGNRKDIRNAVAAAAKASHWAGMAGHARAQVLYFMAENLDARANEFKARIRALTGAKAGLAKREVEASISRLFTYAAWADKHDGAVHDVPLRGVVMAMHEPVGVLGLICPEPLPLLGLVSLLAPAIAMGNRVVIVPSYPLALLATDFYQVLDTSDVPGGVVNIVTGDGDDLAQVLAEHDEVDGVWYHGSDQGSRAVEAASIGNLKRTWVNNGLERDWFKVEQGEGREFLRQATNVKNVWTPYGD